MFDGNKDKVFYIGIKILFMFCKFLLIKLLDIVGRLFRLIEDFKYWKVIEFKNWLLYYFLLVFCKILNFLYIFYWFFFVGVIGILCFDLILSVDFE